MSRRPTLQLLDIAVWRPPPNPRPFQILHRGLVFDFGTMQRCSDHRCCRPTHARAWGEPCGALHSPPGKIAAALRHYCGPSLPMKQGHCRVFALQRPKLAPMLINILLLPWHSTLVFDVSGGTGVQTSSCILQVRWLDDRRLHANAPLVDRLMQEHGQLPDRAALRLRYSRLSTPPYLGLRYVTAHYCRNQYAHAQAHPRERTCRSCDRSHTQPHRMPRPTIRREGATSTVSWTGASEKAYAAAM